MVPLTWPQPAQLWPGELLAEPGVHLCRGRTKDLQVLEESDLRVPRGSLSMQSERTADTERPFFPWSCSILFLATTKPPSPLMSATDRPLKLGRTAVL